MDSKGAGARVGTCSMVGTPSESPRHSGCLALAIFWRFMLEKTVLKSNMHIRSCSWGSDDRFALVLSLRPGIPYGNFTDYPVNLNRRILCPAGRGLAVFSESGLKAWNRAAGFDLVFVWFLGRRSAL